MRILSRAFFTLGAVVLILFAVSNRQTVSLALWPLPFLAELPLYIFFFSSLLLGLVGGAVAAWVSGRRGRRELRRRRRRIEALERELAATQSLLEHARDTDATDQGRSRLGAPQSEPQTSSSSG